jgi:fibronectin-binding autotransporter adhesin
VISKEEGGSLKEFRWFTWQNDNIGGGMNVRQSRNGVVKRNRPDRRKAVRIAVIAGALSVFASQRGFAANGTWSGLAGDGLWETAGNWDTVPGSNAGLAGTSADVATFNGAPASITVTVDANRNVAGVTFDSATSSFNVGSAGANGGNTLYLTGGGTTQVTALSASTGSYAVNAPGVLLGSSYTFVNNSTTAAAGLKINGNITGGSAVNTMLTLDGVNEVSTTTSNTRIAGNISNGAATSLGITKQGTGVWELTGTANTYTGDTVINAGLLRINALGAMSPDSNYIINNGGTLRANVTLNTAKSITINTGGIFQANNSSTITNVANDNGFAVTMNYATASGAVTTGAVVNLTGATAGQGGIRLLSGAATGQVSWSQAMDLGLVSRTFEVADSPGIDPDLQMNGVISGSGGIIKTGPGTLKFQNAANTFTGQLEVREGVVRFATANALVGTGGTLPTVLVSGGTFNVQSSNQTVGAVTVTKGTLMNTSSTGIVTSSSYTFNVAGGDAAAATAVLADSGGPSPVVKNGLGTATLTGTNTYTGATTVNAGLLVFGTSGSYSNTNITVAANAAVGAASSLNAALINRINSAASPSIGAIALNTADAALPIDFTISPLSGANSVGMSIGAMGSVTYTGTLTPDPTRGYRVGGSGTLTLANVNALTGANNVTATNGGTVVLAASNNYTGSTTVDAGTKLQALTDLTTSSALSVGGTLELAAGGTRVLRSPSVTVTGAGRIDLHDNKLITQTAVGTWTGSNYTGVTGLIKSGRNGGGWTGSGIVTSQTQAASGNLTTLGIATASQAKGIATTATAVFSGQTVTGSDTLVMYTYGGDANLDGKINVDDYTRIDFNVPLGATGWFNGDFNYDGKINVDDYTIIDFNVGIQGAQFPTGAGLGGVSAVPEPSLTGVLALGALAGVSRRRRRQT